MSKKLLVLASLVSGLSFQAFAKGNKVDEFSVIEMGSCHTPKHLIQFYPVGKALLLPPDSTAEIITDANEYANAKDGESKNGGVWTSWRVRKGAVLLRWLQPSYWAPLTVNLSNKVCRFSSN